MDAWGYRPVHCVPPGSRLIVLVRFSPVPTATVTRATLALVGLTPRSLAPEPTPKATRRLQVLLEVRGFDLTRPIRVRELPAGQGFRLEQ
jgi:hypothetical protein